MLLIKNVPFGFKTALPPKPAIRVLVTLPNTVFVAYNWLPLMASVLLAVIWPAATFLIWRGEAADPTETTSPLAGALPAKLP